MRNLRSHFLSHEINFDELPLTYVQWIDGWTCLQSSGRPKVLFTVKRQVPLDSSAACSFRRFEDGLNGNAARLKVKQYRFIAVKRPNCAWARTSLQICVGESHKKRLTKNFWTILNKGNELIACLATTLNRLVEFSITASDAWCLNLPVHRMKTHEHLWLVGLQTCGANQTEISKSRDQNWPDVCLSKYGHVVDGVGASYAANHLAILLHYLDHASRG